MKGTILVTDSLFIFPEHEQTLREAGYQIERLDKPEASEEELIEHLKGKVGYVLGGIEHVTDKVIESTDQLRVIAFTGIAYKDLIPGWECASRKGIAISNTPSAPTHAVAEWAITMALAMNRGIFQLGRGGDQTFLTTAGLEAQNIGIIGMGHIGQHLAEMLPVFRPASILYYSRNRHEDAEARFGVIYRELAEVLSQSDVVFLCISKDAGENFMDAEKFDMMKDGALMVSFVSKGVINESALLAELKSGKIRAVSDHPMDGEEFKDLPLSTWFSFNASNAFNTKTELKLTSDMVTQSMLNLLETGKDQYRVN